MDLMAVVFRIEDQAYQKWDSGDRDGCVRDLRIADRFLLAHLLVTGGTF